MRNIEIEKFTLSRNDSFMEGWPDMIRLKSGRILVIYNECTAHLNRDNTHITMRKSDDNGLTWSEKQYIGEETHHGDQWNSIRVNQLSDGRIVLVCDRINKNENTDATKFYTFESTDNGDTWSEKYDIGVFGFCSDKIRELSDGSLLLCVSRNNSRTQKAEIFAHKSYDGGKSWTKPVMVASNPSFKFIEPAAMELKNGTIAVFIRENSMTGEDGFVAYSKDKGKSFYGLRQIPIKGMHRPFIGRLSDGSVMLSYREVLSLELGWSNLKMAIFSESTIEAPDNMNPEIYLVDHDTSDDTDQGYSAWFVQDDGNILMVNYGQDDAPKPFIKGYRIRIGENNA